MEHMKRIKGISLIVLVITIIIMIILSGAVILALVNGGVIGNANKATTKNDLKALEEELQVYNANKALEENNISSAHYISADDPEIYNALPSLRGSKYDGKIQIEAGKIVYIGGDATQAEMLQELGYVIAPERQYAEGGFYSKSKGVNIPQILGGMTPIKWTGNGDTGFEETQSYDVDWYSYTDTSSAPNTSKWANAKTNDGSMWVWIPRYAYKITYTNSSNRGQGGTIDIIFLRGNTNTWIDSNGNVQEQLPNGYIVHPVFQNESTINYKNGGWDKEIPGFWIAKFEAGFEDKNTSLGLPKLMNIKYNQIVGWWANNYISELGGYKYWYNMYGQITTNTYLSYAKFAANQNSYNYVTMGDCHELARGITNANNPYGLGTDGNSHLTKNSEWGAVAYLAHSKYGRNAQQIEPNSSKSFFTIEAGEDQISASIKAITAGGDSTSENKRFANAKTAMTTNKLQSTTGNEYGIYDMSGGLIEYTAGYAYNWNLSHEKGANFWYEDLRKSTRYKSFYYYNSGTEDSNRYYNLPENATRKGEAIWETSNGGGYSYNSWHNGYASWLTSGFTVRGSGPSEGSMFGFSRSDGPAGLTYGWRPCLTSNL